MAGIQLLEEVVYASDSTSDAELIAIAKDFNASAQFHYKKSTEDFWRLGEALTRLRDRPTARGRWRHILAEIGINRQTDNHARRLYDATTLEKLGGYKNKTAALRDLGLLAEPTHSKKLETPDRTLKLAPEVNQGVAVACEPPVHEPGRGVDVLQVAAAVVDAPNATIEETIGFEAVETKTEPIPVEPRNPLHSLARIAGILEYMVEDEFEFTPEIVAQVERASKALDLLRRKGVAHAAA